MFMTRTIPPKSRLPSAALVAISLTRVERVPCWSKTFLRVCSFAVHVTRRTLEPTDMSAHSCFRQFHKLFPAVCLVVGMLFATNLEAGKNKKKPDVEQPQPP